MKTTLLSPALLAGLLAAPVPALAAPAGNVLANGDFRDGLAAWSRLDTVSWSANGATASGSARVTLEGRAEGTDAMLQCVAVDGFRLYDLSASALLPAATGSSGGVSVRLAWYSAPSCQGPTLRGAPSLDFSLRETSGWQVKEQRRLPAPEAAVSAMVVVVARAAGDGSYSFLLDDVVLRLSVETDDLFVPTAASIGGAMGERFATDIWIHNPAPATRDVELRFRRAGTSTVPVLLRVGPEQTRHLGDVLAEALGMEDSAGALQLSYDPRGGPLLVSAGVVTVNPSSPGNGGRIPVFARSEARSSALFAGLSGARGDEGGAFRVNAGAFNPHDGPAVALFTLYDGDGTELGTFTRTLAPGDWLQVNDVFREVGAASAGTEGARLAFRSSLPVFPFVVAVDNRSGDGTFLTAQDVPVLP